MTIELVPERSVIAQEINAEHAACLRSLSDALAHAIRAGELLMEAKALCEHGAWLDWLSAEFDGSVAMANRYMRVAREWPMISAGLNSSALTNLSVDDVLSIIARLKKERKALARGEPLPLPEDDASAPLFQFEPETTNVWTFGACDPRFGADHPGRIPGEIMVNLVHLYTEPGDLVLDPFAGSGTTLDVCRLMGRGCTGYDIAPRRPDIEPYTAQDGAWPGEMLGSVQLVMLDPPYWKQKQGEYTADERDLSNLALDDFYRAIESLARSLHDVLTPTGSVALILSQARVNGVVHDLAIECAARFDTAGYTLVERIVVPYANAASDTGYWHAQARDGRWLMRAFRDLMVFRASIAPTH